MKGTFNLNSELLGTESRIQCGGVVVGHSKVAPERVAEIYKGHEVAGMAYPCEGVNNDERVARLIGENTGIKYARTITYSYNFDRQEKLLRFDPAVYIELIKRRKN